MTHRTSPCKWFSNFSMQQTHQEGLLKPPLLGPTSRVFDSVGLRGGLRIWISKQVSMCCWCCQPRDHNLKTTAYRYKSAWLSVRIVTSPKWPSIQSLKVAERAKKKKVVETRVTPSVGCKLMTGYKTNKYQNWETMRCGTVIYIY